MREVSCGLVGPRLCNDRAMLSVAYALIGACVCGQKQSDTPAAAFFSSSFSFSVYPSCIAEISTHF